MNKETAQLVEKLANDTKSHLGPDNCVTFDPVEWNDRGGTNEESLKDYLEKLGQMFEQKVKMLIDRVGQQGKLLPIIFVLISGFSPGF